MQTSTARGSAAEGSLPPSHGELPRWDVADLPAPPPFGARNLFKIIGPGAVMAAMCAVASSAAWQAPHEEAHSCTFGDWPVG